MKYCKCFFEVVYLIKQKYMFDQLFNIITDIIASIKRDYYASKK